MIASNLLLVLFALSCVLPCIAFTIASAVQWCPGDDAAAFTRASDAAAARWVAVLACLDTATEYTAGIPLDGAAAAAALDGALGWLEPRAGEGWLEPIADDAPRCTPLLAPTAPRLLRALPWCLPASRGAAAPPQHRGKARPRDARGRFARAA